MNTLERTSHFAAGNNTIHLVSINTKKNVLIYLFSTTGRGLGSKSSASSASCTFLFTIFFSSTINFGVTFEADRSTTGTFFSFLSGSPLSVSFIASCTVFSHCPVCPEPVQYRIYHPNHHFYYLHPLNLTLVLYH